MKILVSIIFIWYINECILQFEDSLILNVYEIYNYIHVGDLLVNIKGLFYIL